MTFSTHTPTSSEYFAYGLLGMPLAMLSLPLYVYLPTFYAESTALSLTAIGLVLYVFIFLFTMLFLSSLFSLSACSNMTINDYAETHPTLDLFTYFVGKTKGWGMWRSSQTPICG